MVGEQCWDQISSARGIDASSQSHSRSQNDHFAVLSISGEREIETSLTISISNEFCRFSMLGGEVQIPKGSQKKLEEKSMDVGKVQPLQISIFFKPEQRSAVVHYCVGLRCLITGLANAKP